ncbi:MAG: hypothetical protein WBC97_06680 [Gemmatimonadales bacterium]
MTPITRSLLAGTITLGALGPGARSAAAQRTIRIGVSYSGLSTQTSGDQSSGGIGLSVGYLSHPSNETVLTATRWPDASFGGSSPGATAFTLDDRWYPVDATGLAPYVITGVGAFRYTEPAGLLTPEQKKWGFSYIAGFGIGTTIGQDWAVSAEGRLRSDDGDRNIEYRLGGSWGFGKEHPSQAVPGTIEPFIAWLGHLNAGAPYRSASPLGGVRFRRDLTTHRAIAVEVGLVELDPATTAPLGTAARTTMYLMQPSYEFALAPRWGRAYLGIGPMLAGFIDGPDAGLRAGIQAGVGADFFASGHLEAGLLTRVSWFQSAAGADQFGLMLGLTVGPRLHPDRSTLPNKAPTDE